MKIDVYHYLKTAGSVSCGWLGKYRFREMPKIGDFVYSTNGDNIDKYVVTEIHYLLKGSVV